MSARHPRAATPVPTMPPPEPAAEQLVKRLNRWHLLAGIAVVLLGGGFTAATYFGGLAKVADVDQVRAGAAAQLGPVLVEQHAQGARTAVVESAISDLHRELAEMRADARLTALQLVEIAKAVGARQVALPPPAPPPQPP